jgi:hypothetical protein
MENDGVHEECCRENRAVKPRTTRLLDCSTWRLLDSYEDNVIRQIYIEGNLYTMHPKRMTSGDDHSSLQTICG